MTQVSRRGLLAGAAALSASAAMARPRSSPVHKPAGPGTDVDAAVNESLAQHAIPGAAVAVARAGKPLYVRGYGLANLETATPVTPATIFRYGSLTKQFVCAAAIKLAALGKLDLKAPVSETLSTFSRLKPFSTLELMHQTAGLHSDESEVAPTQATKAKGQFDLAADVASQASPFDFDPGTAWLYSNANYIVLGAVIEAVSKMPLAEAMKKLVFGPLDLASMAFDTAKAVVTGRASGYAATGEAVQPFDNASFLDPSQAGGAGAQRGNVTDLVRWHHSLLSGQLFDRASIELMTAPGKLRDGRVSGANRHSPQDAQYGETQYACGLLVSGPTEVHPSIMHYGSINGFSAMVQTFTRQDISIAALCNTDLGPGVPFRGIRKAVISGWLT